ncbi:MAG: MerR family transcriptional regulator [Candidatus Omnitrophica bacterium]|nr:MerR family transcriptional regulator [Candidatus Omnitrophota bacterium]
MTKTLITAHEVVQRHRLSYQTLNYYTNLGLLRVAKRNGNERLYKKRDVQRQLAAVGRLKDEGYPLRLISQVLHRRVQSNGPRQARRRRAKGDT